MKILLAYSKRHFDPAVRSADNGLRFSSAAILAAGLYEILSRFGEVDYVDGLEPPRSLPRRHYDLLVSILGGISPLHRLAGFDKTVLFAVNMHPAERNRILHEFNVRYRVCGQALLDRTCVFLKTLDDIKAADAVFMVGNGEVLRSYVRRGVPRSRLRCFNYASALEPVKKTQASPGAPVFVYAATEMCLRKGFDIMSRLMEQAARAGENFRLLVIGAAGAGQYRRKLESLQALLGPRMAYGGWVDSSSREYAALLDEGDFILFPSLEEGQAGSVLDAMARGLVPIVTRAAGIDCSPFGFLRPELDSPDNLRIIFRALHAAPEERLRLSRAAGRVYADLHLGWREPLARAFGYLLNHGSPWPRVIADVRDDAFASDYPALAAEGLPADYILRGGAVLPGSADLYDFVSFMEKNPRCGVAGAGARLSCKELYWREGEPVPVPRLVRASGEETGDAWVLESCAGEEILSALAADALPPEPPLAVPRGFRRFVAEPAARIGSLFAPSRRMRRKLYNYWRESR